MTDAEKELRRLAEGAKSGLVMSLYPVTVLALLNRIEALEKWQDEACAMYVKGDRFLGDFVWAERHRRAAEEDAKRYP